MGFFSKKKETSPPQDIKRVPSNTSVHSASKLKLFLKPKIGEPEPAPTEILPAQKRTQRVSTIIEADDAFADFDGADDYEDEEENDLEDGSESDEDDYEEHDHVVQVRDRTATILQLSTLMGYCGLGGTSKETLKKMANEELLRTYSLLNSELMIHRVSPTMNKSDPRLLESVIGDDQVALIEALKQKLNLILDLKHSLDDQYDFVNGSKTLFDRYGSIKDVIGRGAYGVIKIIDPDEQQKTIRKNVLYAVKELQKRPGSDSKTKETRAAFIERVLSEFILSSTLNSKHIVRTVDFMITLPPRDKTESTARNLFEDNLKINQVMECTNGGDLFTYLRTCITNRDYISIDEIDCMVKQIAKGLWYMHNHGVAHCDLKLENVLLSYDYNSSTNTRSKPRTRMNLKISDFGKSNVFRTQWDSAEQLTPFTSGPLGSEPYMAPEEHTKSTKGGYSLSKKDCWSFGVLILVLFNIRRNFFFGKHGNVCLLDYYDEKNEEEDTKTYGSTYLWRRTDAKLTSHLHRDRNFKDAVFDEFVKSTMIADYDKATREWTIQRKGSFLPIETLFDTKFTNESHEFDDLRERDCGFESEDFEIRKYFIYKLLDMNPTTRVSIEALLKSDWLVAVESCCV